MKPISKRSTLTVLAGSLALSGCVTLNTYELPETLPAGAWRVGADVSVRNSTSSCEVCADNVYVDETKANANLSLQRGVTDRLELGARLGSAGLELNGKLQLSPSGSRLAFAVSARVGGVVIPNGGGIPNDYFGHASLQAVVGLHLGAQTELVVAGGPISWAWNGYYCNPFDQWLFGAQASAGVSVALGDSLRLFPMVSVGAAPLIRSFAWGVDGPAGTPPRWSAVGPLNGALLDVGVGLSFEP